MTFTMFPKRMYVKLVINCQKSRQIKNILSRFFIVDGKCSLAVLTPSSWSSALDPDLVLLGLTWEDYLALLLHSPFVALVSGLSSAPVKMYYRQRVEIQVTRGNMTLTNFNRISLDMLLVSSMHGKLLLCRQSWDSFEAGIYRTHHQCCEKYSLTVRTYKKCLIEYYYCTYNALLQYIMPCHSIDGWVNVRMRSKIPSNLTW